MNTIKAVVISTVFSACAASNAFASPVVCQDTAKNYMTLDGTVANSCLDSGTGNINGSDTDLFADGTDWSFLEKSDGGGATPLFGLSYTAGIGDSTSITGQWSIDASFWDQYSSAALGFKFGTGNTPDEWFVFDLSDGATSGSWTFYSTLMNGNGKGGLSHTNLYAKEPITPVSEPGTLGLIGIAMAGIGISRRKKSLSK